jgi:hypothetical protein
VLGHDVDDALVGVEEVPERVLGVVEAPAEADGEYGRVVVADLRVAERREVRGCAVETARGEEADGARDYARDEELVVGYWRAVGGVGVDLDVFLG